MPQINKPTDYFNTVLYTGTGAIQSVTGVGFQPDWLWTKIRSDTGNHTVWDSVRGANASLQTSTTNAEGSSHIDSFDSDGFTLDAAIQNNSGETYVGWNWLAGGTASSNTDGTITSSVSASTASGFSIVSYTGTGSAATVGHGLNSAPEMIILKNRDVANNWITGCEYYSGWDYIIELNLTDAESNAGGAPQNFTTTPPTSSVYSVGTSTNSNGSGNDIIAYCFHSVKGYSKIGKYTGNGNADGTFVYTGFKPAFLMVKKSSASGSDWNLHHNKSPGFNVNDNYLAPNSSAAEVTNNSFQIFDFCSNGFKCRGTGTGTNASGETHIYMAFASSPLVGSNNIPTTAR